MKKAHLFILMTVLMFTGSSFGALNAYLTLAGENQGQINGEVTQSGHEDTIEVNGFSHVVHSPRDGTTGYTTGQRQHEPLRITKKIDKSTPLLMNAWANSEMMIEFQLRFVQISNQGTEVQYYSIILHGARIAGIRQEMPNNQYPDNNGIEEMEHVTFVYNSIEWVHEDSGHSFATEWQYAGADLPISDISGDGVVNLLDFAMMADEWLANE